MHVVKDLLRLAAVTGFFFLACGSAAAQEKPLKIFVLVGQSNMQGHAHVRTLPHMGMDPSTSSMLAEIQSDDGEPDVFEDIWISYLSSDGVKTGQLTTGFGASELKIGPELTFGIYMQKKLQEPILIIKAAWGGKSLNTDFRPPSAGPYVFDDTVIELLAEKGAGPFGPEDRPMKEYAAMPVAWREGHEREVNEWIERAIAHTRTLPPKKKKAKKR